MLREVHSEQPFRINTPTQPNRLSPWLAKPLENFLCFPRLNALYGQVSQESSPPAFLEAALRLLNIQIHVSPADVARIPTSGPVVVVANHPFGLIEGMLLAHILFKVRPDVKVMANFLLAQVPQTQELCIFVDPFDTSRSTQANIGGLRSALNWLHQGKMLVVFPAGEVAHIEFQHGLQLLSPAALGQIVDPVWNENVARLIRRSGAAVLPAYIQGNNGLFFHLAGLVHPRLRTSLLPREFLNKCDRQVEVRFGSLLSARHLEPFSADEMLISYLRQRTYALSSRQPDAGPKKSLASLRFPFNPKPLRFSPIIAAQPQAILQNEITGLPPEQLLGESGDMAVFYAEAGQIPYLLQEIGRLREISFRGTGEGTGKAVDLDNFDQYYLHLFIWNRAVQEVVGSYRVGRADMIIKSYGLKGLYSSSLFHYSPQFIDQINSAIELGRSFVRPEYQREYAPLLMLWRGIGQFLMHHPQYKIFFGPVSISNTYTTMSRELLVQFLQAQYYLEALAPLVKPRNPLRQHLKAPWKPQELGRMIGDLEALSQVIQDIETDQKGIPILLKQYLKFGARVLAFNVDRDFCNVLDALVWVDVTQTEPKILRRYVDQAQLDKFMAYHQSIKG